MSKLSAKKDVKFEHFEHQMYKAINAKLNNLAKVITFPSS